MSQRVLITGGSGFVGQHLAQELISSGFCKPNDVIITSDVPGTLATKSHGELQVHSGNILDRKALAELFNETKPDAVVHLAAVSHVVNAQNEREKLSEINNVGTHNVCAAAAAMCKPVSFLFVSSSLVYGSRSYKKLADTNQAAVFNEDSLPDPESAYGASKLAGEYIVRSYASTNFKPYITRPFNHIGPGQSPNFVCPTLARKVAEAREGGTIHVGNLLTFRDFSDVRDVVRAYRMILEQQPDGDLFVIGSGNATCINDVLQSFLRFSGKNLSIELDPGLLREVDPPKLCADPTKIRNLTGWEPTWKLQDTLKEVYDEWLARV